MMKTEMPWYACFLSPFELTNLVEEVVYNLLLAQIIYLLRWIA